MRSLFRLAAAAAVRLAGWVRPPSLAQAANLDTTADFVFGQPDFNSSTPTTRAG